MLSVKEYEGSISDWEGEICKLQSWLTNSACRTLFRMCDDGLFNWDDTSLDSSTSSLHRDFDYLVIGQDDMCFFDSWKRMCNVNSDPW